MRKVFLDDLPIRGNKRINWQKSIGYKVRFIYDDIEGEVEIIDYCKDRRNLLVEYNNKLNWIHTSSFSKCKLRIIIGLKNTAHKYNIGDIIGNDKIKIKILEQIRFGDNNAKAYKVECQNCNYTGIQYESNILKAISCPTCGGKKVKVGYNDIWTKNPTLASMLNNPDDGYKYTIGSNNYVDWRCPNCHRVINNRRINTVNHQGLSCSHCSDGVSYPEKFMMNLLEQLGLDFEFQKSFYFAESNVYDFYIHSYNMIIETHGMQHYKESNRGRSLIDEQRNDEIKRKIAIESGIDKYIIIDCRYSNMKYIQKSTISSIGDIFNLDNVDWELCDKSGLNSLIIKSCNMWEDGVKNINEIASILKLHRGTVTSYLKKGAIHGWCSYNPNKAKSERSRKVGENNSKSVICLTTGDIFKSMTEASNRYKISQSSISENVNGKLKSAGKHIKTGEKLCWMLYEDYLNLNKCNK